MQSTPRLTANKSRLQPPFQACLAVFLAEMPGIMQQLHHVHHAFLLLTPNTRELATRFGMVHYAATISRTSWRNEEQKVTFPMFKINTPNSMHWYSLALLLSLSNFHTVLNKGTRNIRGRKKVTLSVFVLCTCLTLDCLFCTLIKSCSVFEAQIKH